ncbi:MAG: SURF1 family protein [Pseudoclavibacter sp.]|nr:SURF1 family protein [Pseudoclavibacter sp.]
MSAAGWRFALSPRWLGYLALVLVFATACVLLSRWQFDRREERVEANHRIERNYDLEPRPLAEVLPEPGGYDREQEWTPVLLHGRYLAEEQLLVRARPHQGMPGFEILVPFRTDEGRVFVVDRGWLPQGNEQDEPDEVPTPPAGDVTVVARLKAGEPEIPGRSAPPGQIATIHLPEFAERLSGERVDTGAYGLLAVESPGSGGAQARTGALAPRPVLSEGNHLSYAFQWLVFALIAALGLAWGIRNEYRHRNPDDPRVLAARRRQRERRARRGRSDAEEEDELIDAGR